MSPRARPGSEPDWLNPANDRKTPYTGAELDTLAADFIAMNSDAAGCRKLVAEVGEQEAVAVMRQRLAARDPLSLLNWKTVGAKHGSTCAAEPPDPISGLLHLLSRRLEERRGTRPLAEASRRLAELRSSQ